MKKFFKILLIVSTFLICLPVPAKAAGSASLTASKTTVEVGQSITVTATISGNSIYTVKGLVSTSNASVLSGGGEIWKREPSGFNSQSFSFSFKANQVGTATITLSIDSENSITLNEELLSIANKTITINVVEKSSTGSSSGSSGGSTTPVTPSKPSVNYSKDNNLKSLTISEGTLSPAFNASTKSYTVELGATVKSLKVDAVANDKKASVKGTGTKELEPGENTIKITVTAENGNPKVYTITAIVDEKPLVFLPYNGGELGVVRNLKDVPKLDGFEETKLVIEGNETRAWHSSTRNITLIYLQNGDSKDFYIYDEAKGVISIYKPLGILGNNLGIIDIPEELKNKAAMQFGEVEVDGLTLNGWTYDNEMFKNYSLIYAMDESGNYNYYQYEKTQNTLQLYSGAAPILQEDYDAIVKENEKMTMYFYIACGVAVVSLVLAIVGFVNANKYKNRLLNRNEVKVD